MLFPTLGKKTVFHHSNLASPPSQFLITSFFPFTFPFPSYSLLFSFTSRFPTPFLLPQVGMGKGNFIHPCMLDLFFLIYKGAILDKHE